MKNETTILFDLDGTLIDSTEAILESFEMAYGYFSRRVPSEELILAEIGHPLDRMFISMGISEDEVWDFVAAYKEHYRKISREKTTLLPDAYDAVIKAADIARLGVVTTKTAKYSVELLEHMEIMSLFDVLIGREDVVSPKPHPEPIYKALEKMSANRERCWMIGDTCMDMIAAKEADIGGIAVLSGYGKEKDLSACSRYVTKDALEAVSIIAGQ